MSVTINGVEMPKRIWLTDEGSGDICWATDPDPGGCPEAEAVEYVRVEAFGAVGEEMLK